MENTSTSCCAAADKATSGGLPRWATRPRLMIMAGTAVILGGATLNWGWLTALGLAPFLLAVLPCGLMCAAGLCMKAGPKTPAADGTPPVATGK